MSRYGAISLGVLVLLLTGCSSLTGTQASKLYPQRYTLPAVAAESSSSSPQLPIVLAVAPVAAPRWLNSPGMVYRLAYDMQSRLAAYSRSRWAGPPASMVGQTSKDALADSGLFKAVTDAGAGVADIVLRISLTDFEQVFTSRQQSVGVLDARVTLLHAKSDEVLAQHAFHYRVPAPSADAAGGIQALGKANSQFAAGMLRWLQQALSQCSSACLRAAP